MKQLKITPSITRRDHQSLDKYLQEIGKEPMITAQEEVALAEARDRGDRTAIDKLTRANLRFVVSVAKQYQSQGTYLLDLINEGNIGLIKAAEKFDPTRGFKFISYAVWRIRQSIMAALSENNDMIRKPLNQVGRMSQITKTSITFEQLHQRKPTSEEIAQALDLEI
jgi:RNA polymerase primary sigma factor